ncbi:hypothetical protein MML63_12465 [Kosakonia sacchari]|uniref:tail fiber/spike domain-containing protein n=1 Tax=Kosakonia sacchari TaxID=1158459 RepID=UPI0025B112C8|nr:hypothetical protein [Kosakonia sacchari]MDN2486438.1 hypothetical protein [Kosakonia sacchari]
MTTTPTNLPVPSESPRDLKFNAGKIDEFVTAMVNTYADRFGIQHYTIEGLRWLAQQAIAQFGYITLDSFEDGNTLTLPNQVLRLEATGEYYRWDGSFLPNGKIVPASSTPESTGGIGVGAWLSVGDSTLRGDLLSGHKAALVGYGTGTVKDALDSLYQRGGYIAHFDDYPGVVGDGVHDDTAGMNAATLDVALKGGGTLFGSFGKKYRINGTVYVTSNTIIDFRMAEVIGNRGTGTQPTLETATLKSGALVSNISSVNETEIIEYLIIKNARVSNCHLFFNSKNFNKGCSLQNLKERNCLKFVNGSRSFFSSYHNIELRDGSDVTVPLFDFTGENNDMLFSEVSGVVEFFMRFSGGTTAVRFNGGSFEGGQVGWDMQNDCLGVVWDSVYVEAVQGVAFRFLYAGTCQVKWTANYLNYVDIVFQGPDATGALFGVFDESNSLVNVGSTVGTFTYRGIKGFDSPRCYIRDTERSVINGTNVLPSNVHFSPASNIEQINVVESAGAGDVAFKNIVTGGVVPVKRTGNIGKSIPNIVAGCTHAAFQPGNTSVTILLDTKLNYSDLLFAKYSLVVSASSGNTPIFGDIFGTQVSRRDPNTTIGISLVNASGFARLEIGPFTSTGGAYTLTGAVQLLS